MKKVGLIFLSFLLYAALCLLLLNFYFLDDYTAEVRPAVTEISNSQTSDLQVEKNDASRSLDEFNEDATALSEEEIGKVAIDLNTADTVNTYDNEDQENSYVAQSFSVNGDNGKSMVDCNGYTTIYKDQAVVKIPFNCSNYGVEIEKILKADETAMLTITGYSTDQEDNSLGKERANYIKKLLIATGIDGNRININSTFQNIVFTNGIAKGGVYMKMKSYKNVDNASTSENSQKEVNFIKKSTDPFAYKKIISGFQGDYFYGNQTFTLYINKIKEFLQEHPDKKLKIYSHTTSVGNDDDNMTIAKSNITNAQKLILQSGIPKSKIESYAMGEQPVDESGSSTCLILTVN